MGMHRTGDTLFLCAMAHGAAAARRAIERPRYADMAADFHRICAARPYLNHCIVARDVGARAFDVSVNRLIARTREGDMTEMRQRIMAFVHVVTGAKFSQIGKSFDRDHSAVSYACDKYADAIRAEIGG
jgi:chromosomal replication initiation ATPase DnaA